MRKISAMLAALAILLLCASVRADLISSVINDLSSVSCGQATTPFEWLPLASIGIMISITVGGLAYMLSQFISSPKMAAWSKSELYQAAATAAMVMLFFGSFTVLAEAASHAASYAMSDTALAGKSSIDLAFDYSNSMRNLIIKEFVGLTGFNLVLSLIGSLSISIRPMGMGISFQLTPIFKPLMDGTGILINLVMTAIGEWWAHNLLLCFIQQRMLTMFLPLGILARCFTPTRAAGGALIAIALGLYFVYPLMLNLNYVVMLDSGGLGPDMLAALESLVAALVAGGTFTTVGAVLALSMSWLSTLTATLLVAGVLVPVLVTLMKFVVHTVLIGSMLLPIFNIFVTLTIIKELAKFLGSDVNLSSLTKLV